MTKSADTSERRGQNGFVGQLTYSKSKYPEQGDATAQYLLGVSSAFGEGVLLDSVLADMWLNIAGANGKADARERRDELERDMTRARSILRLGDGLSDRDGVLGARNPDDQLRLERLVAAALPVGGAIAVSGLMLLGRSSGLPPFVVHVKPAVVPQPDYGARRTAALVLIVEPGSQHRIDPGLVARTLGLTPMESRVAAWLAEGRSVDEMAGAMGNTKHAIYWHLQRIYRKLSISRQAELVRLVLPLADLG